MRLRFLGAAEVVTGSKTLVRTDTTRILVDCGLFQGFKHLRERNWESFDVFPLDAIVLTHAHLDHSGYVPALVRRGYDGPVFCTEGTAALLGILWPDAAHIQEEDAERANRKGYAKHKPALPLYTAEDARKALSRVVPVPYDQDVAIGDLTLRYQGAGHILGAASALLRSKDHRVLFSGDLGRDDDAVVPAPDPACEADTIVMETTYGNRNHPDVDKDDALAEIVRKTVDRRGMVLIPSFAVGRAQGLLWSIHQLKMQGRIPDIDVVLDSPMATRATAAFLSNPKDLRLAPEQLHAMTEHVEFTSSANASKALNDKRGPFILISASGMLTGGRVLHHIVQRAPVRENTLLFVGFQAPGTRGSGLVRGDREIRVFGRMVDVQCHVAEIGGFSAHADQTDLVRWLEGAPRKPSRVFLNHGEPDSSEAMRRTLRDLGYNATVATERVEWQLGDDIRPLPTEPIAHPIRDRVGGVMQLLSHADGLTFSDDDPGSLDAIRGALALMAKGDLPRMPIVVRGAALARRVLDELPPDSLAQLRIEG